LKKMQEYRANIVATGLAFPEGPRWRDDRFWFTDQHDASVYQMTPNGQLYRYATTEDRPGGIDWLPDGSLLVVYMTQQRLMRRVEHHWEQYADLSELASYHCNDLVVGSQGAVFMGNFGEAIGLNPVMRPAELIRIDPNGKAEVVDREVVFPNGSVITDDGCQLRVAETFAHRITQFDLDQKERITHRRVWAELGAATPDGICLDAEDALWVASPKTHELLRVARGGRVLARCLTQGAPYACMLGGDQRRTLYICTSESDDPIEAARIKSGRIESSIVDVAGAGRP
jgi:sugar lactone lactonase YvrE